jgi:hypothetical protein
MKYKDLKKEKEKKKKRKKGGRSVCTLLDFLTLKVINK